MEERSRRKMEGRDGGREKGREMEGERMGQRWRRGGREEGAVREDGYMQKMKKEE